MLVCHLAESHSIDRNFPHREMVGAGLVPAQDAHEEGHHREGNHKGCPYVRNEAHAKETVYLAGPVPWRVSPPSIARAHHGRYQVTWSHTQL